VPEALAWSARSAAARLRSLRPDVVIAVTARAFHPSLVDGSRTTVVDLVDRLSVSYRDRAGIETRLARRYLLRALAQTAARFEHHNDDRVVRTAAGWSDAIALRARWIPNVVNVQPALDPRGADRDVLLFGNLSYEPNIAAAQRLATLWPEITRRRPETTCLLAGARPTPAIRQLAAEHGWQLVADFDRVEDVCRRARLAIAPLAHVAGIQNKILEAAAYGLPQVISPEARSGLDPDFPVAVASDDGAFVDGVVALLDDEVRRRAEGSAAQLHTRRRYSARHWAEELNDLFSTPNSDGGQRPTTSVRKNGHRN
jgi:hypothetical protein